MKISIITFSRAKNYGGILQAYALYRYLADQGYECEFIDYILARSNIYDKKSYVDATTCQSRFWGKNKLTKCVWSILIFNKIRADYGVFFNFIEQKAKFSKRYFSLEELIKDPPIADVYITGSDQVWNTQFTKNEEIDLPFYLAFAKGKKISYASSFGRDYIRPENEKTIKKYLSDYAHISVREPSGQMILEKLGIDSTVVLDPTLLCKASIWNEICSEKINEQDYILLYQVRFNKGLSDVAKELARKNGKKLITITMNRNDKRKITGKCVMTPTVKEWLSYIKNADAIITDSFHATVFSILFKKNFAANVATRKEMSGRISNLLKMLELDSHKMTDMSVDTASKIIAADSDWDQVETKLEEKKRFSQDWLKTAIEN